MTSSNEVVKLSAFPDMRVSVEDEVQALEDQARALEKISKGLEEVKEATFQRYDGQVK